MVVLKIAQAVISLLLIIIILIQNRGGGLGGVFGGSGNVYMTKRGLDKKLYVATIVLVVAWLGISLAMIIYAAR
jgi:preprotein translocase subunit SecG